MDGAPSFGVSTEGALVQADLDGMIDASRARVHGRVTARHYATSMNGIVFAGGTGSQSFFPEKFREARQLGVCISRAYHRVGAQ